MAIFGTLILVSRRVRGLFRMILKRFLSKRLFRAMLMDVQGATAIEYGLIIAIISVSIIAGLQAIGGNITAVFKIIEDTFIAAMA